MLLSAAAALILTGAFFSHPRDIHIDFERGYETAFVEDFHPRERAEGRYFRWTKGTSFIELYNLPSSGRFEVEALLRAVRPSGEPVPILVFTANGVTVHRSSARPGTNVYNFDFIHNASHLRLGIETDTFEASGGRHLGVQVLGITVKPPEEGLPWVGTATALAVVGALLYLTAHLIGFSPFVSGAGAITLSFCFVYLGSRGSVPFTHYPRTLLVLAMMLLIAALSARFSLNRLGWLRTNERPVVVGVLGLLLLVELVIVTYPLMLSSDANFQANRMGEFLSGNWHPTSVTQHEPAFRIPYPVSLYVVAAPLTAVGLDSVTALEIVVAVFDVLVSALLVFLGSRFMNDLSTGLLAAVLYQLVPMNAWSLSAGNFTNIFAVAMLAVTFCLLLVAATEGQRRAAILAGVGTLTALTAHFGVLLEGVVLWPTWMGVVWLLSPPLRDERRFLTLAVTAGALAAGLYYLGYWELFGSQWERALEQGGRAGDVASPLQKLSLNLAFLGEQWGWVFVATVFLGAFALARTPLSGTFTAAAAAWLGVTLLYVGVDLVSSLGIRYYLQMLPLAALLSAGCLSRLFGRGRLGKMVAIAAVAYMGVRGIWTLYDVLLIRYH